MSIVIICLSVMLFFSIKRNLEYMTLFDEVVESYRELFEQLNYYHDKFDKKSKLELFLDEPVTRELVEDIKGTKKAIKFAAEKISVFIENENEES